MKYMFKIIQGSIRHSRALPGTYYGLSPFRCPLLYAHAQNNNYAWATDRAAGAPPPRARVREPKLRACAGLDMPTSYTRTRIHFLVRVRKRRHAPCKHRQGKIFKDFPTIYEKISRFLKDFSKISKISPRFPRFLKDFQDFSKISKISPRFRDFRRDFQISLGISAKAYEISGSVGPLAQNLGG